MSCGIYKITNLLNNHAYIGESKNIERRWAEHRAMKYRASIYDAFQKYGIDNFSFEIIEECSEEKLCEREKYWIEYYDTYHNGYNMTQGGEGGPMSGLRIPVVQYDLNGNFIAIYESILEAEKQLQIKPKTSNITRVCKGEAYESNGFQWKYLSDVPNYQNNIGVSVLKERLREGSKKGHKNRVYISKKVAQCDKNTHQIIQIFDSIKEASQQTGVCFTSIYKVCRGTRQSAGGYYWIDYK